jgi:hypothetical protein
MLDVATTRRFLPGVWECLRAVSGLVAIVALLGIVAGAFTIAQPEAGQLLGAASMVDETTAAPPRDPASHPASPPPSTRTITFYLVATPAQEFEADWSENVDSTDSRDYRILYARDETELQAVQQAVLEYMLSQSNLMHVRVIDLRSLGH